MIKDTLFTHAYTKNTISGLVLCNALADANVRYFNEVLNNHIAKLFHTNLFNTAINTNKCLVLISNIITLMVWNVHL